MILPSAPRCGFSRQIVEMLDEEGASYDSFNILEDEEVRQGLKTYSDWPTYPQLYVDGDLIGGLAGAAAGGQKSGRAGGIEDALGDEAIWAGKDTFPI